ncbi:hypothetical protein [Streptomyces sp. FIT100]|uniref:hypothetical protein n=1 Tax=Streptomyces sp. FIT100 TaxID=2837956 RepID=UPI0021C5F37A|nr:hypothetical protein [Streptomyces sp. FIT100]UUN29970.1 hypothetical protein KK483_29100 [Streptomyces sp. FIT100]
MRAASAASSPAARTGAFVAGTPGLFRTRPGFPGPGPAVPGVTHDSGVTHGPGITHDSRVTHDSGVAGDSGVTAPAAPWTLPAYPHAVCSFSLVGGRPGEVFGRRSTLPARRAPVHPPSAGRAPEDGGWTGEGPP